MRAGIAVRFVSRLLFSLVALVVCTLVSIQFVRVVNENVAMARSLSSVRRDIAALQKRKREEAREIRRLSDPQGAIPEIHDRLHLVRADEALIYLKPPRH